MNNLKLGVEVVGAHDLMPKDGQGSANTFVELRFDHQKFRTSIKDKDLSPVWNESFYFNISDPNKLSNLSLEAIVYHHNRENSSQSILGKVRLTGTSFVPYSDAVVLHYPLEKQGILSRVKGELGLKVFVTDGPSIRSSNPLPATESSLFSDSRAAQSQASEQQIPNVAQKLLSNNKSESRQTFHHLPNPSQSQKQQHVPPAATQPPMDYGIHEMKSEPQAPRVVRMFSGSSAQPVDYALKETSPFLGGGQVVGGRVIRGDRPSSSYDLVEQMKYLYVRVVKAQDLPTMDVTGSLDPYVEVKVGNYKGITKHFEKNKNPEWNEVFAFAGDRLQSSVLEVMVKDKDLVKDDFVGIVRFDRNEVPTRVPPDSPLAPECRWFGLEKSMSAAMDEHQVKKDKFSSRLHLQVVLDGGYHVLDESTHYSSDLRPTAKQLWKPPIGVLELGVLNAVGLHPMKTREGKGTSDTYCVAKYGQKWIRTRTIINSLSPKYNEQYTWEVFDPATVLIVGVFDNNQLGGSNDNKDTKIGKVRIRLSTLETGRVYTHSYPLLVLQPSGVKKMGELHLAIRFSNTSFTNMVFQYSRPLLPKMHYVRPLTVMQQDMLRHQAVNVVAARLGRSEPPLRKEVIEYISDADSHLWSMRRSKANFFRLMSVFSGLLSVGKWFSEVCMWKNPITTVLVQILFVMLLYFPELILPTAFLYMFLIGVWNYRFRPRYPPHMNTRISHADAVNPDELDEEFDTFPSRRSPEIVRFRYDRLRSVAGRIQTVVGDVATQGERVQALLSWRDPRATTIFLIFCLVVAIVLYATPFQAKALQGCQIWMVSVVLVNLWMIVFHLVFCFPGYRGLFWEWVKDMASLAENCPITFLVKKIALVGPITPLASLVLTRKTPSMKQSVGPGSICPSHPSRFQALPRPSKLLLRHLSTLQQCNSTI
ncbi:hypothetical protein D5086_025887 [Populus alba]|uniref:Uncharacterized protein n=1 Tax=Populus alba TaxID=43335 RepID=A0ACC4B254_POPAL